jgi:hypothetical protein
MENPIKPNTKIRILSAEHLEYVRYLAIASGIRPSYAGGKMYFRPEDVNKYNMVSSDHFEEIFIDLPDQIKPIPYDEAVERFHKERQSKKHSHYFKDVSDIDEVDVYRVCDLFEVNDASGATQHAIKKLLCSGKRGAKDERKDLEEARDTIIRKLEMMKEDRE